ncbi:MAG TPA: Holliday junction resolvase-like protein [Rectinemataceae bacterium]|nr:Holliday junction resolvase-like protein [Rectinemataceae bacterium]
MTASPNLPEFLLFIAAICALALLLVLGFLAGRAAGRSEARRELPDIIEGERNDAVRRSRAVLGGLAAEQLAPWLPGFPWDPTELRFVGKPLDFIVFKGASRGEVEEVVFVEVKTGSSAPSRVERSLRDAVLRGRVSWSQWRPGEIATTRS